jgi:hypothetical protein
MKGRRTIGVLAVETAVSAAAASAGATALARLAGGDAGG